MMELGKWTEVFRYVLTSHSVGIGAVGYLQIFPSAP